MPEQATNEYEQLYVPDQAQAALAAADILKLDHIVKQATVMVQRAEDAVAKSNPASSHLLRSRKGLDSKSNPFG